MLVQFDDIGPEFDVVADEYHAILVVVVPWQNKRQHLSCHVVFYCVDLEIRYIRF
ncbi:Uncharacterized protein APZ42_020523 [Daphnia magna]|uniref:Uncharacterized protein n=1 Tax=Daphnia magna TaxID=35525 RepID=A0A164X5R9_9CRUS|nr:Uncharacterized protein APZ42_020523 [Daphnia magna]